MAPRHALALLALVLGAPPVSALGPRAAPLGQELRSALTLELLYGCPSKRVEEVDVYEGTQLMLRVPEGCTGAGEAYLLELKCARRDCRGVFTRGGEPAAEVRGSRRRLRLRGVERWATGLKELKLRVVGESAVAVASSGRRDMPVWVRVANGPETAGARLASGEARVVSWPGPRGSVSLALHVRRASTEEAHLTVVSDKGHTVLNSAFPIGSEQEVGCEEAELDCQGRVRFRVEEAPSGRR